MKAAFLVGLTTEGPKLLTIYPDNPKLVSESFRNELTLKCMPIGAKDGDFHSFIVDHVQIISIIIQIPSFEECYDCRDTYVSLGVIVHESLNPQPYRKILEDIATTCKAKNLLDIKTLKSLPKKLYHSFRTPKFTLEIKKGINIEFTYEGEVTEGQRIREALKRL